MKHLIFLILTTTVIVHACNPIYEMCMKTAQAAVDACSKQQELMTSCACSAEKQVLACYSECPPDDKMFEMEEKKMAQIAALCNQPAAEGEALNRTNIKQQMLNDDQGKDRDADEDKIEVNNDSEGDETGFHAAALPEPIHVDEPVFGQTHAKDSQMIEQKAPSSTSMTWISLGSIFVANALLLLDFVTI